MISSVIEHLYQIPINPGSKGRLQKHLLQFPEQDFVSFPHPKLNPVNRKRERELLGYAKEWQPIFVTTLCFRLFLLPDKRIRHKSYPYPLRIHIFCSNF